MAIPIRTVIDDARVLLGQHPELGRTSTVSWAELVGQVQARVRVGRHSFETDEPEAAGGEGRAPSPMQYACGALAACEVVTYRYWSELLETPFDTVEVEVRAEGDIRVFLGFGPEASPGVNKVTVAAQIRGPLAPDRYQELHDAVRAHCPVLLAFSDAPIESHLTVGDGR
jgi:putative redox protein